MADYRQFLPPSRSIKSLQENLSRGEPGILAGYALVGAVMVFGGIGYVLDQWRGTSHGFLLVGLLLGIGVGFYTLVRTVWPQRN